MDTFDYIVQKYNIGPDKKNLIELPNIDRNDLAELFVELGFKVGAEIGVEQGLYTRVLCKAGLELYAVDAWKTYKGYRDHVNQEKLNGFLEKTKERLSGYNYHIIRHLSIKAVKFFGDESLDFVYIDGNHTLPFVINDIIEWSKKVKKGGIVSGHDYIKNTGTQNHVVHAISCYVNAYKIHPLFLVGTKEKNGITVRDKNRSWFYVKE